ncbi:MAG TPA: triose-phosphate isomerase [Acidobacteriota bacterium]|nr:triose-phosphate isomerase [Acidobacteriota bacterium]
MKKEFSKPLIAINFKSYETAVGSNAMTLTKKLNLKVKHADIAICVSSPDITACAKICSNTFAQHVDGNDFGAFTGSIHPKSVKDAGAVGTLINHSERQLTIEQIKAAVDMSKKYGLVTIVCANTPKKVGEVAKFNPDFIAYEPPELIGGDVSVTTKPLSILKAVQMLKKSKTRLLVGAGVKTGEDVSNALKLGAKGVLLASGITKAKNPRSALLDLLSGISAR